MASMIKPTPKLGRQATQKFLDSVAKNMTIPSGPKADHAKVASVIDKALSSCRKSTETA